MTWSLIWAIITIMFLIGLPFAYWWDRKEDRR